MAFLISNVSLMQAAIKIDSPEFEDSFNNAIEKNKNFKDFINKQPENELKKFGKKIESFNTPEDKVAFNKILEDVATNPNYDFSQLTAANIGATIANEKAILAGGPPAATPPAATPPAAATSAATPPAATSDFELALKLDPEIEKALANAVVNNSKFANYLDEKADPSSTDPSLIDKIGKQLITRDINGNNPFLNTEVSEPFKGILNSIANNPNYDVQLLDNLTESMEAHAKALDELQKAQENFKTEVKKGVSPARQRVLQENLQDLEEVEHTTKMALIDDVRAAGGEVHAFAKMDRDTAMAFMGDLFKPGKDAGFALDNLIDKLGVSDAQATALREQLTPFLNLIKTMLQPYAELFQKYSPAAKEYFGTTMSNVNMIAGHQPVFSTSATTTGINLENVGNATNVFNEVSRELNSTLTPTTYTSADLEQMQKVVDHISNHVANQWDLAVKHKTSLDTNGTIVTADEFEDMKTALVNNTKELISNYDNSNGNQLTEAQEAQLANRFENKFSSMTGPM